jgi:hypothetical protein
LAAIVESRFELEAERSLSPHTHDTPDQLLTWASNGHEILDLGNPVRRQEAGDQHVAVGKIELLGLSG